MRPQRTAGGRGRSAHSGTCAVAGGRRARHGRRRRTSRDRALRALGGGGRRVRPRSSPNAPSRCSPRTAQPLRPPSSGSHGRMLDVRSRCPANVATGCPGHATPHRRVRSQCRRWRPARGPYDGLCGPTLRVRGTRPSSDLRPRGPPVGRMHSAICRSPPGGGHGGRTSRPPCRRGVRGRHCHDDRRFAGRVGRRHVVGRSRDRPVFDGRRRCAMPFVTPHRRAATAGPPSAVRPDPIVEPPRDPYRSHHRGYLSRERRPSPSAIDHRANPAMWSATTRYALDTVTPNTCSNVACHGWSTRANSTKNWSMNASTGASPTSASPTWGSIS